MRQFKIKIIERPKGDLDVIKLLNKKMSSRECNNSNFCLVLNNTAYFFLQDNVFSKDAVHLYDYNGRNKLLFEIDKFRPKSDIKISGENRLIMFNEHKFKKELKMAYLEYLLGLGQ